MSKISMLARWFVLFLLVAILAACAAAPGAPAQTTSQPGGEKAGPTGNELLVFQLNGGIEGLCEKLTVFKDGHATLAQDCHKTSKDIQIAPDKFQQLQTLATELGALSYKTPDQSGADMLSSSLEVYGTDKGQTPDKQKLGDLINLLTEIDRQARMPK